jgi:hypothetical protein
MGVSHLYWVLMLMLTQKHWKKIGMALRLGDLRSDALSDALVLRMTRFLTTGGMLSVDALLRRSAAAVLVIRLDFVRLLLLYP